MKVFTPLVLIGVIIIISGTGCSKEEDQPSPVERPKVVVPIIKPPNEVIKEPVSDVGPGTQPLTSQTSEVMNPTGQGSETEPKPPEAANQENRDKTAEAPGIYIAKKGESLASISGRIEVYGNALNWPILFRLNLAKLENERIEDDLPDMVIREDVRLKIVTPDEMRENLKNRADKFWVINILSVREGKEVVSPAIKLIKGGYLVYITSANVKGKPYQRLRVGFFKNREEAEAAGKKIMSLLNVTEFWPTKVTISEHEEFAGY
jgi:hypothetical protein